MELRGRFSAVMAGGGAGEAGETAWRTGEGDLGEAAGEAGDMTVSTIDVSVS